MADAQAAVRKTHPVTHARSGPTKHHAAGQKFAARKAGRKVASGKAAAAPSLAITIKAPNDAPDFDYTDRIEEAQALVAKQPVQPGDMVIDSAGKLSHFVWMLAVGKSTGPLTVVRMDEARQQRQGPRHHLAGGQLPQHQIPRRRDRRLSSSLPSAVRCGRKRQGYEEAVYTAYAPELDTKKMRDAGMDYLRHLQRLAYNNIKDHDVRSRVQPEATPSRTRFPPASCCG